MRYAIVRNGELSLATGPLTLEDLQHEVGGLIEPAFTVPSKARAHHFVTGYINESGMIDGLRPNVITPAGPLFGPLVITGLDPHGETCELNAREFAQVRVIRENSEGFILALDTRTGEVFPVPMLSIEGAEVT